MVYEFCTYDVKRERQDEFEVLLKEAAEYCRIENGVHKVSCIRQDGKENLIYVLHVAREESGQEIVPLLQTKYGRRFLRCVDGVPRAVAGVEIV